MALLSKKTHFLNNNYKFLLEKLQNIYIKEQN